MRKPIQDKRQQEKEVVELMIELYCRKHHGRPLCQACTALRDYAFNRIDHCPHMETKTFCSACKTHCYKPNMRHRIRQVMAFSGPRMLLHHPILAVRHLLETMKQKRGTRP